MSLPEEDSGLSERTLDRELSVSGVKPHHVMAVSPWASFFPALSLYFSICEMGGTFLQLFLKHGEAWPPLLWSRSSTGIPQTGVPWGLDHFQEPLPFQVYVITPFVPGGP